MCVLMRKRCALSLIWKLHKPLLQRAWLFSAGAASQMLRQTLFGADNALARHSTL
jgi:hypothetical protein